AATTAASRTAGRITSGRTTGSTATTAARWTAAAPNAGTAARTCCRARNAGSPRAWPGRPTARGGDREPLPVALAPAGVDRGRPDRPAAPVAPDHLATVGVVAMITRPAAEAVGGAVDVRGRER